MTGASQTGRLTLAFGALGLITLMASPAFAQTELIVTENPIKKVKKLVNTVTEEAQEAVDETQETVDEVVDDTQEKVDEAVDDTQATVDETKKDAERVIDKVLGETVAPNPARPNEPKRPSVQTEPRRNNDRRSRVKAGALGEKERAALGSRKRSARPVPGDPRPVPIAADSTADPAVAAPATPGEIAQRLVFPLLMTALVVAFLVLQGRFDKRDPKLEFHFDLDGERLSFD